MNRFAFACCRHPGTTNGMRLKIKRNSSCRRDETSPHLCGAYRRGNFPTPNTPHAYMLVSVCVCVQLWVGSPADAWETTMRCFRCFSFYFQKCIEEKIYCRYKFRKEARRRVGDGKNYVQTHAGQLYKNKFLSAFITFGINFRCVPSSYV